MTPLLQESQEAQEAQEGQQLQESKHRDVYASFAQRLDKMHRLVRTMLRTEHDMDVGNHHVDR